jgi:hypothetical protein
MIYQAAGSHFSGFHEFLHQNPTSPLPPGSIASEPKQLFHKRHISIPSSQRQKRFFWTRQEFPLSAPDRVARQPASSTRKQIMASNNEVFVCSCGEELKTKDDVDRQEIHKNWKRGHGKQLKCQFPDCETISPQTSNAKRHWRSKHVPARLGHYFCTKCGAGYAKREDMIRHRAAPDCRPKNRKRCRRTSERDAAPSPPPAVRQTAADVLNLEADEPFPPHPEETSNDMGPPSASSTAPHAAGLNHIRLKSQGSFTIGIAQQNPAMWPADRQDMMLTIQVSGTWESRSLFYWNFRTASDAPLLQLYLHSLYEHSLVHQTPMGHGEPGFLDIVFVEHAQSLEDGISSTTWSINIEWSKYQLTCHWKRVDGMRHPGQVLEINQISVTDEKRGAPVVCRKNRKGSRSVFEEDHALPVPSITPQNGMSSPDGHAAESEIPLQTPSKDISQPSAATVPLPTIELPHWTPPGYTSPTIITTSLTPDRGPVNERSRLADTTLFDPHAPALRSPWFRFQQEALEPPKRSFPENPLGRWDSMETMVGDVIGDSPELYKQGSASSLESTTERQVTNSVSARQGSGSGVAPTEGQLPSAFRKSSMRSYNPGLSPRGGNGFIPIQHPDYPRAHTEIYTCPYLLTDNERFLSYYCIVNFESQSALQRHERDFHGSQTRHNRDSGTEAGAASVSPRSHARLGLGSEHESAFEHDAFFTIDIFERDASFTIDISQDPRLTYLKVERAGRRPPKLRITLEGCWTSIEGLLNDFPKFGHLNPVWKGPSWTELWRAMMKTMTARPPELLAEVLDELSRGYPTVMRMSVWSIGFLWVEEKIVVYWDHEWSLAKPANTDNGVSVRIEEQ